MYELRYEFDRSCYQVIIVADKYQTGFDQPKLVAMYVDKKLKGVAAVQTLSRLNRVCRPYEKTTFILDFKNDYKVIEDAFSKFYHNTILFQTLSPSDVRDMDRVIEEHDFLDYDDIEEFNHYLLQPKRTNRDKQKMWSLLDKAVRRVMKNPEKKRHEICTDIRSFLKAYCFIIQASAYENVAIRCDQRPLNSDNGTWTDVERMEWQARKMAPKILMPRKAAQKKLDELKQKASDFRNREEAVELMVKEFADCFGVSEPSAAIRMVELGFKDAEPYCKGSSYSGFDRTQTFSKAKKRHQPISLDAAFELYTTQCLMRIRAVRKLCGNMSRRQAGQVRILSKPLSLPMRISRGFRITTILSWSILLLWLWDLASPCLRLRKY